MSETRLNQHNASLRNYNLSRMAGCIAASKKVSTDAYMINCGEEQQANKLFNIKADIKKFYKNACGFCAVADCEYRWGKSKNMLAKTLKEDVSTSDRFRDRVKLKTSYGSYENGDISCERLMQQPRIKKQERFEAHNDIYTQKLMNVVNEIVANRVEIAPIDFPQGVVEVKLAGPDQYADEDSDWKALMAEEQRMNLAIDEEDMADIDTQELADTSTLFVDNSKNQEVAQISMDDLMNQ